MKYKMDPVKGQKFEWGRTINPFNCDCKVCTFMNCPKHNYAVKMKQHKYTVKEFVEENREAIKAAGSVSEYLCDNDGLTDFMDSCVGNFPKGTYWNPTGYSIELVTMNRSKYGPDFNTRAEIEFGSLWCEENEYKIRYYSGCTDTQEQFVERLQKKFMELKMAYEAE